MSFYEHHVYEDNDLKIRVHKTERKMLSAFPLHWHKSPELWLVLEGSIYTICDGVRSEYKTGEIAIANSNQIHEVGGENCVYYTMIIDSSVCSKIDRLPQHSANSEAIALYNAVVREYFSDELNHKEACIGYAKALLAVLSREAENRPAQNNPRKTEFVKSAADYISEHFKEALTLEKISAQFNLSQSYLSHIFKEITGTTIIDYLISTRCTYAKSLLKTGKYTVSEVCFESGFSNLSYFSKAYKKTLGRSPHEDITATDYKHLQKKKFIV